VAPEAIEPGAPSRLAWPDTFALMPLALPSCDLVVVEELMGYLNNFSTQLVLALPRQLSLLQGEYHLVGERMATTSAAAGRPPPPAPGPTVIAVPSCANDIERAA